MMTNDRSAVDEVITLLGGRPIRMGIPAVRVRRFTVEEFHRMIDARVFGDDERFELLEGWVVACDKRDPACCVAVGLVGDALRELLPKQRWRVRNRAGMTTLDSETEPDVAVVRANCRDRMDRHPMPPEIDLIVEVVNAALLPISRLKTRVYARAGIPVYWIVNLVDGVIEVYTQPTGPIDQPAYRERWSASADDAIPLALDGAEVVRIVARDVLP